MTDLRLRALHASIWPPLPRWEIATMYLIAFLLGAMLAAQA